MALQAAFPSPYSIQRGEIYPSDSFRLPVDASNMRLSGTFGELRDDHFHSGIDLSGDLEQPVYAAADGYVHRIRVQADGYGNALYLRHANGYTTVYAHLHRFSPAIARYVRAEQYRREQFEVDLFPNPKTFTVKRGERIGTMGNSGNSKGVHLHFEIRRTADQKALNPLLFRLPIPDRAPPEMVGLKAYCLNPQREALSEQMFAVERRADGSYRLKGSDTLVLPAWRAGFALSAFDRVTGNPLNQNGLFSLRLFADGRQVFGWRAKVLSFDETRYLNAHVDYAERQRSKSWFQRCYLLPGDRLSQYEHMEDGGVVPLYRDRITSLRMVVADAYGNTAVLHFWARRGHVPPATAPPHQQQLAWDQAHRVDTDYFSLAVPKGALYENLYFRHAQEPLSPGVLSPIHLIHHKEAPLHRYCTLSLRPVPLAPTLRPKAVVLCLNEPRPVSVGGRWTGETIQTRIREWGRYAVGIDTVAPTISPEVFSADMRNKSFMAFIVRDNLSTRYPAHPVRLRAEVDGQWVLFEHDAKNGRWIHYFDERTAPGKHWLRLVATDDRENTAVFEAQFIR